MPSKKPAPAPPAPGDRVEITTYYRRQPRTHKGKVALAHSKRPGKGGAPRWDVACDDGAIRCVRAAAIRVIRRAR